MASDPERIAAAAAILNLAIVEQQAAARAHGSAVEAERNARCRLDDATSDLNAAHQWYRRAVLGVPAPAVWWINPHIGRQLADRSRSVEGVGGGDGVSGDGCGGGGGGETGEP